MGLFNTRNSINMLVISVTNNQAGSFDPITVKESYSQKGGLPAGHKVIAKAGLDNSNIDLFAINAALGPFFTAKKACNKCRLAQ